MVGSVQGKKQLEGDCSQRQEQRFAKPSTPHQIHECTPRGMDPGVDPWRFNQKRRIGAWRKVSQPHFGQVWGWSPTLGKVAGLESSGTPECLELDSKVQNISHWGVLGVISKVLKRRYRKWPRIGNSHICSPSYGQKKGRESNWQFDSRPLKVGNRPLFDVSLRSVTQNWKALNESYNIDSGLVPIQIWGEELWPFKVPGVQPGHFRDSISGVPTKCAIRM
jgi:hypothetical protein